MRCRCVLPLTIFGLLGLLSVLPAQAQPAHLVADLNTTVPLHQSGTYDYGQYGQLVSLGNAFFFAANDNAYGAEVWRSDGTPAGTRLLKDICPGACSSRPRSLIVSNGALFFLADDGYHGEELWKSDGTAEGTVRMTDAFQRPLSWIGSLTDAGGVLFFFAQDDVHGAELWTSDGTPAGTHVVRDIVPGTNGISWGRMLATSGRRLLFAVDDRSHGIQPWASDGTAAGTLPLAGRPGGDFIQRSYDPLASGQDAAPAPDGGFLFAGDDGTGTALWHTDGTPGGTVRLSNAAFPHEMTAFQGAVCFVASDSATGSELWKSDGTAAGTLRVADIRPGSGGSDPRELTVAGNRLYFRATDGVHGAELWRSDGTAAGTLLARDLNPGPGDAFPLSPSGSLPYRYQLSAFAGGLIFFSFDGGGSDLQLWWTDGVTTTKLATTPASSAANLILAAPRDTITVGGRFYFLSGPIGSEIWSSDGTPAGTQRLVDVASHTSSLKLFDGRAEPHAFGPAGNQLFFAATDGVSPMALWKTDGTAAGTSQVANLPSVETPYQFSPWNGGVVFLTNLAMWASDGTANGTLRLATGSPGGSLPVLGGSLFYFAFDFPNSLLPERLDKTNGTPGGTVPVAALSTFNDSNNMVVSGGRLFVPGFENGTGSSLWVTDGTAPGTLHLSGLAHGQDFNWIGHLLAVGGTVFFTAYEDGYGWELWKSDGTAAGTMLLKSSQPFPYDFLASTGEIAAPAGGPVFFVQTDPETGAELWKSDGTAAGTVRVADIAPGPAGSHPRLLTAAAGRLYFVANDGVHGDEPWVSDGTAAGTHMVADLLPGPDSSRPDVFTAVGDTLLFAAFDGVHGLEPWRTDGTPLGTRMIQDIAPGPLSSSPSGFMAAGPNVYFAADDGTTGFELWAVPKTNVLATFGDVPTDSWAWSYVEALAAAGITTGCAPGLFCPAGLVTRAEMAAFLERGIQGPAFTPPPPTGTVFLDVPAGYWAAGWIEQLAADGITTGCSPNHYCPDLPVNRSEMAVFLLRARHGGSYVPPHVAVSRFADVPAGYWAQDWIEQLAAEAITTGCAPNAYCPGDAVGRDQMAAFLARTFHLTLP